MQNVMLYIDIVLSNRVKVLFFHEHLVKFPIGITIAGAVVIINITYGEHLVLELTENLKKV